MQRLGIDWEWIDSPLYSKRALGVLMITQRNDGFVKALASAWMAGFRHEHDVRGCTPAMKYVETRVVEYSLHRSLYSFLAWRAEPCPGPTATT